MKSFKKNLIAILFITVFIALLIIEQNLDQWV